MRHSRKFGRDFWDGEDHYSYDADGNKMWPTNFFQEFQKIFVRRKRSRRRRRRRMRRGTVSWTENFLAEAELSLSSELRKLVELSSPWPNGEKAFSIWTFRGFLAFFIFFSRAKAIGAETKLIKEKRRTRSPSCLLPVQCAQWLPASLPACLQNISLLLKNHF